MGSVCHFANAFIWDGTFVVIYGRFQSLDIKLYLSLSGMDCATLFTILFRSILRLVVMQPANNISLFVAFYTDCEISHRPTRSYYYDCILRD